MAARLKYPIPPNFLNIAFKTMPIMIGLFASMMRLSDYVLSGSFFRAANLSSCCDTFDFIVVGGGSAGSVIAARLSENRNVRVLLLEAGGDPNPYTYVPAVTPDLSGHPATDWKYETVPQNGNALSAIKRQVLWPRGKSLGGCSNINFMIYMRGNPHDFDRWAEYANDTRWGYRNMEKYFRKMEDYDGHWTKNGYHGKGGPLRIEKVRYAPNIDNVMDAAKEMGFDVRDLNQDQTQGFSPMDLTMKRGFRYSTFRAYVKPSLGRSNLAVYRYSHVTKIHFDENQRAIGVTFFRHGVKGYAQANKEIIVSAGAINSPQLLMLSGIGPKEHLVEHRIPPISDLPVGQNLQDHVTTAVGPFVMNGSASSFILHRDVDVGAVFRLFSEGTGPLTSNMGVMAVGLASSSFTIPDWPDVMYTVAALGVFDGMPKIVDKMFNTGTTGQKFLGSDVGKDSHFVLVTLGLPKSRGYIKLKDKNPLSKPIINPQYYSDPDNHDVSAMVEGIELLVRMYENTTSLQKLDAHLSRSFPGCENVPFKTSLYYECLLKTLTLTLFHPSGTCAMGHHNDPRSVVDSKLRVLGVKGLRVADTSVMPFVTNANTNAPTIAIAEVCADMIKEDWNIK